MTIRLSKEQRAKITDAESLFRIMQQVLRRENSIDRGKEHAWVASLASNMRLLNLELVSLGNSVATSLDPVDVFGIALQKQARKIILVHNHPSDTLKPSDADSLMTEKMLAVGKFLRCPLVDHLIVAETGFYSYAETGHLKVIRAASKIDLTFKETDRLQQMVREIKEQRDKLAKQVQTIALDTAKGIAKKLLAHKMPITEIVKVTGLTEEAIEAMKKQKKA